MTTVKQATTLKILVIKNVLLVKFLMVSKKHVLHVPIKLKELSLMLSKKNVHVPVHQTKSLRKKMVQIVLVNLHTMELVMLTFKNVIPNAILQQLFGKIKQLLVKLLAQHVKLPKEKGLIVEELLVKISAQIKVLEKHGLEQLAYAQVTQPVKKSQMKRIINVISLAIITLKLKLMVQLVNAMLAITLHLTKIINLPHAINNVIQQEERLQVTNVNVIKIILEKNVILIVPGLI